MTANHSNQPLHGASEQDRARLGVLLQRRRSELGYGTNGVQRFARDRGVSWRAIYDIEKATRDGFMVAKVDEYARAYEVTYDSLVAVGQGEAGELTAAPRTDELAYELADDDLSGGHLQQEVSIEMARARLGDLVDRARYTGDPALITRNGKPAALIAPILGISDRGAVAQARKLAAALGDGDARYAITDLLYILDRYLAADLGTAGA